MEAHGTRMSESRKAGGELSLAARTSIVSRAEPGASKADLAREFDCDEKCIRDAIRRYNKTGTNQSKHRSGQPPKLNHEKKLYLCRIVQNSTKITYEELQLLCNSYFGKDVSEDTLYRALKAEGISISGAKGVPKTDGATAPRTPTILREIPTPRPQPQKRRTQGSTHTLDTLTTLPIKRAHTAQQCKSPKRTRVISK